KWKGVTSLGWKRGDWSTTLNAFYTHSYDQAVATAASAPGLLDHVKPYHQLDLHVGYSGFDRTVVSLSVQNLTDKDPPFDPASTYSSSQYNLRGQFINLGIDYRFR
ncbi:MAG: TonB-dependent receptor, partial [Luteimonas sp.]